MAEKIAKQIFFQPLAPDSGLALAARYAAAPMEIQGKIAG
jgi:predicted NodU family carbamoyl transferase